MSTPLLPIVAALRSGSRQPTATTEAPVKPMPFITITRQAGAGGGTLARRLADRLNCDRPNLWQSFDRELVERIAQDHDISRSLLESLEIADRNWVVDLIAGIAGVGGSVSEIELYRKVAQTVQVLARRGHVVIVGRGARFITENLAGGTHILVVAPLPHRVAHMARHKGVSLKEAERVVHETDGRRRDFYRRHWPDRPIISESFDLTLNSATLGEERMVECVMPLVTRAVAPRR